MVYLVTNTSYKDGMEDLEGVIGLPEVVGESEGMFLAVGL